MKKLMTCLLALVLVLSLTACGGKNDDSSNSGDDSNAPSVEDASTGDETNSGDDAAPGEFTTVEPGKLHMSTNAAFPPYEMLTDDGSFEGIDVEVAEAIAEKLGLELVINDMGFTAALTAVQQGQSDIAMAGITATDPERLKVMDFSDSYATGIQVIIVPEDSPIQSKDDLANAGMIGTQAGTTGSTYCTDDYGTDHVTEFETGSVAVMALINGQIDAVVIDNEPAKAFVAANEGLKILDTEYANEDYAIGFAKGNDALREAVNAAMAELKADGTFQSIVDKYITAE